MSIKKTTNLNMRIDVELKEQAEQLFSELGLNMTTAFNIFMRQSVRLGKIPFDISLNQPNVYTVKAIEEAEKISNDPKTKRYNSFAEIVSEVQTDV